MSLDYLLPYSKPFEEPPERFPNAPEHHFWTTGSGIKKHISELEDAHLINIIRMVWLKREAVRSGMLSRMYEFETMLSSDHALDAIEHDISVIESARPEEVLANIPKWNALIGELKKRGYKFWGIVRDVP